MSLARELVDRSLAERRETYSAEVDRLIEAAYAVIADSGNLDPPIRAILAQAGLSNPAFYRHFRSKDELFLVMLDDGRRRLVEYLAQRTAAVDEPGRAGDDARIGAWIRGVLAQAGDDAAARRTRPFVAGVERLRERFPDRQAESERQLVAQLADLLGDRAAWAETVYRLVVAELDRHLRTGDAPSPEAVDDTVRFALAGITADHS